MSHNYSKRSFYEQNNSYSQKPENNYRSDSAHSGQFRQERFHKNKSVDTPTSVLGKRDFLEFRNGEDLEEDAAKYQDERRGGKKQLKTDYSDRDRQYSREDSSKQYVQDSPEKESLAPWMTSATRRIKNTLVRFHNEVVDFVNYITPSQEDHKLREKALERLKKVILEVIPTVKIIPFGSFATYLYLPHGDIDIVLVEQNVSSITLLNKLAKAFMNNSDYDSINVIRSAKVPLIKVVEKSSGFNFDLSFNKLDGVHQLREIQKGLEYYPEMRHILLVMKCFLRQRDLNETYTGGFGSFLLFCLILTYLREVRREYIQSDQEEEIPKILLSEHLIKFFDFYANFDIMNKQIIVAEGGAVVDKYAKDPSFSLVSPQDATHDLGSQSFKAKEIFGIFKNRYHFLTNYNFSENESILKYLFKAEYL